MARAPAPPPPPQQQQHRRLLLLHRQRGLHTTTTPNSSGAPGFTPPPTSSQVFNLFFYPSVYSSATAMQATFEKYDYRQLCIVIFVWKI
jgi:hypothetical protein